MQDAADAFGRLLEHCTNLIEVHREHGGGAVGRRYRETSLNRAVVVLAVAGWQSAVELFAAAAIEAGVPAPGSIVSPQTYNVITGVAKKAIGDYSTPNAENTRRLLISVGFDPRPHWQWTLPGRHVWAPTDVTDRLDHWLRIRHAIAHGHPELPHVPALAWVRAHPGGRGTPALTLSDAESCTRFVVRLGQATGEALASHLGQPPPRW